MADYRLEAEDGSTTYSVDTSSPSDFPSYSGTGWIKYGNWEGAYIIWTTASLSTAGVWTLDFRFGSAYGGSCKRDLVINGVGAGTITFAGGTWGTWYTHTTTATLTTGVNTIEINYNADTGSEDTYFDYLDLTAPQGQPMSKRLGGVAFAAAGQRGRW